MRRLPAFAEATYVRCNTCDATWASDYDAEKVAAANEAENTTEARLHEIARAILRRPVTELRHMADLALVVRVCEPDSDYGEKALTALTKAILRFADVPKSRSSMGAAYKQVARARAA